VFTKGSWLCLLAAVALLVWGGVRMATIEDSRQDEGSLVVEERERDLGEQTLGIHTFELRVHNTAGKPRRIIGLPSG
jgi:hypothetical protein